MISRNLAGAQALEANHRANRLLAALEPEDFASLEPHLETVLLPGGTVLYDTGDLLRHAYFPHDSIVSLVTVMEGGETAVRPQSAPQISGFLA
jgi:hypothetical protein